MRVHAARIGSHPVLAASSMDSPWLNAALLSSRDTVWRMPPLLLLSVSSLQRDDENPRLLLMSADAGMNSEQNSAVLDCSTLFSVAMIASCGTAMHTRCAKPITLTFA